MKLICSMHDDVLESYFNVLDSFASNSVITLFHKFYSIITLITFSDNSFM
jgi:hypothetical protein